MQLICEAWDLLRRVGEFSNSELSGLFAEWNRGELDSYLIGITADILSKMDPETGRAMVDIILDKAGQKGTGAWASRHALEIGMPVPTITEAVSARSLSALKAERVAAAKILPGPDSTAHSLSAGGKAELAETVRKALFAGKIASYAQGFALMAEASREYGWNLDMGKIAKIFRGGCIIRASFLNDIKNAYAETPELANLMVAHFFAERLNRYAPDWRKAVCKAIEAGISRSPRSPVRLPTSTGTAATGCRRTCCRPSAITLARTGMNGSTGKAVFIHPGSEFHMNGVPEGIREGTHDGDS